MPDFIMDFEREHPRLKQFPVDQLRKYLVIPSVVHGYSIAIEFMINWFKSCMPRTKDGDRDEEYFKTVHVSGKHVLDDFRKFNEGIFSKRIKPALTIMPIINLEYDREGIDLYNYGPDTLFRANREIGESFFKDYRNHLYMGVRNKEIEMPFGFRIRVNTKAEQMQVYEELMLQCRVKGSITKYICADFSVPKALIHTIAKDAHFKFTEKGDLESPLDFCMYLNTMSGVPFIYKRENITGNYQYYVRVNGVHTHIQLPEKPDTDDGEQIGQIYDNYMIELKVVLHMTVPHFYYYFSKHDTGLLVKTVEHSDIGVYKIKPNKLVDVDENGFQWIVDSEYMLENEDLERGYVDIKDWIDKTVRLDPVINSVFKYCDDRKITRKNFMSVKFVKRGYENIGVDYETFRVTLPKDIDWGKGIFIIYMSMSFINDIVLEQQNAEKTRTGE